MEEQSAFERLTRREYALIACALGAALLALLPLLLHFLGTRWRPGTPVSTSGAARPRRRVASAMREGAAGRPDPSTDLRSGTPRA